MRVLICETVFRLLDDFINYAMSHGSGRLADAMCYSEAELRYRAEFLDSALQDAIYIYKPEWVQLSMDEWDDIC